MDTLRIHALEIEAIIGHYDWERRQPRTLLLDLELGVDVARAARHDRLEDAVDYDRVVQAASRFVRESRFVMIETLAERLAQELLGEFPLARVKLTVHKPAAVPAAKSVSVTIERAKSTG